MRPTVVIECLMSVLLLSPMLNGQEWTRFRGPNGTGVSDCQTIPVRWAEDQYDWKIELPGRGHSSPVVWGDKVFLLSADPDNATRYVLCYSALDGSETWVRKYESETHSIHSRSSFASSTPAVDAERVYVAWSMPQKTTLKAFDHAGNEVWDLDLGRWVGRHGFGTSPILYQNMLILHFSQQTDKLEPGDELGESLMMAFDRRTGDELWRTPLDSAGSVCYSVPFIYEPQVGPPELVCANTGNGVFSLDPLTGKENWSFNAFKMRTVASPIFSGGYVFGSTGSGGGGNYIVAIKPGDPPELAYELKNSSEFKAPYVPCMLAKGDKVFMLYDRGFASCVDAPTGKVHWCVRTGAAFSGSPVLAGNRIYCIDEEGIVWVIAADETEYRLLAKNPLNEASRSTPAVSGGKLFLRTYSHLFCIGSKREVAGG